MSDRLAVSAAFSVLMMAMFVLFFGAGSARVEFGPDAMRAPAGQTAPTSLGAPGSALLPY